MPLLAQVERSSCGHHLLSVFLSNQSPPEALASMFRSLWRTARQPRPRHGSPRKHPPDAMVLGRSASLRCGDCGITHRKEPAVGPQAAALEAGPWGPHAASWVGAGEGLGGSL